MASGKPLTDREKAFIRANRDEKFPAVIARHLTLYYAEDNGGSRKTSTVQTYIRTLKREAEKKSG